MSDEGWTRPFIMHLNSKFHGCIPEQRTTFGIVHPVTLHKSHATGTVAFYSYHIFRRLGRLLCPHPSAFHINFPDMKDPNLTALINYLPLSPPYILTLHLPLGPAHHLSNLPFLRFQWPVRRGSAVSREVVGNRVRREIHPKAARGVFAARSADGGHSAGGGPADADGAPQRH